MNAFLIVIAVFIAADQAAPSPPAERPLPAAMLEALKPLESLAGDEKRLVDAMREIDLTHVASGIRALELAEGHRVVGETEKAQEREQEATDEFTLVRKGWDFVLSKYNNNARAQTYYGELLYDQFDDVDAALKAWHLASSLDPKLALPLNDLGIHYNHVGQYAQAMQCYDKALELEPNNPDFMFNLVQTYLANFPFIQEYRKWSKPRIYKEAMKLSKKAAELDPSDYQLSQDYAVNFYKAEDLDVNADWKAAAQAWQKARKVARNDKDRFYTWLNEARVWIRKDKKDKAKTCLEESLKIEPFSEVARRLLDKIEGKEAPEEKAGAPDAPADTKQEAAPPASAVQAPPSAQAPAQQPVVQQPAAQSSDQKPPAAKRNFNK